MLRKRAGKIGKRPRRKTGCRKRKFMFLKMHVMVSQSYVLNQERVLKEARALAAGPF
jgi:hypothetical protein